MHQNKIIVNYIPKLQAVDKSVAMIAELKRENKQIFCISILNIESKNQAEDASGLFELLSNVTDYFIVCEPSVLSKQARQIFDRYGVNYIVTKNFNSLSDEVLKHSINYDYKIVLLPYAGEKSETGKKLLGCLKKRNFRIVVYFKSIHDHGMGLSTVEKKDESERTAVAYYLLIGKLIKKMVRGNFQYNLSKDDVDLVLAINEQHRDIIRNRFPSSTPIMISGYPLLYGAWWNLITNSSYVKEYNKSRKVNPCFDVVIFTRGETPGRPASDNVLPHTTLAQILSDIYSVIESEFNEFRIRIKPHPIQDVNFLKNLISNWRCTTLDYNIPALLSATSDLAISTYSSTIIDSLIFNIPSIEYYIENDFFRRKHPAGSPFLRMGAIRVNNKKQFRETMKKIKDKKYRLPDIRHALGNNNTITFDELIRNFR